MLILFIKFFINAKTICKGIAHCCLKLDFLKLGDRNKSNVVQFTSLCQAHLWPSPLRSQDSQTQLLIHLFPEWVVIFFTFIREINCRVFDYYFPDVSSWLTLGFTQCKFMEVVSHQMPESLQCQCHFYSDDSSTWLFTALSWLHFIRPQSKTALGLVKRWSHLIADLKGLRFSMDKEVQIILAVPLVPLSAHPSTFKYTFLCLAIYPSLWNITTA